MIHSLQTWALLVCQAVTIASSDADILLLANGKLQGLFTPVTSSGSACDPEDADACFGGHARRISYYKAKQEEFAGTSTVLSWVDLGGISFGGPLYGHPDYEYGYPATVISNLTPYDACVFAPNDFLTVDSDTARAQSAANYAKRTCPLLLSNGDFSAPFDILNDRINTYIIKEGGDGTKIAIFSMFPRREEVGYGYGYTAINLDKRSRHAKIVSGEGNLMVNATLYEAALEDTAGSMSQMLPYYADVYRLATEVPVDLLYAVQEAKAKHPDIAATVLLIGDSGREDQVNWLATYGEFDIILIATKDASADDRELVTSVRKRSVLVAHAYGDAGFTTVRATVGEGGVSSFEYMASLELNSSVPSNETVQAQLSDFYQFVRDRNANPFGQLTNPITGGHRIDEAEPSKYQCYYMDCPAGDVLGEAIRAHAFLQGFEADAGLYNLGGFRAVLAGDENGVVSLSHCMRTFLFQNRLKVFTILGKDLLSGIKGMFTGGEIGFIGGGLRVAFHEPCWEYVDHVNFGSSSEDLVAPGLAEEKAACRAAGVDPTVQIVDVQVLVRKESECENGRPCENREWQTLEKGRTYTVVTTEYVSSTISGFAETAVTLDIDAQALCQYVAAETPVEVQPWENYLERGRVQYASAEEGWAAGNRIPSVVAQATTIEDASLCPPGKFLPEQGTECIVCEIGTRAMDDSSACVACDFGFFGNTTGLQACHRCPAGRFSSKSGATVCEVCPAGTYSEKAATACFDCRPGFYNDVEEASVCIVCPLGTFSNDSAAIGCTVCGDGLITESVTAGSEEECVCPSGTFRNQERWCEPCPEGFACEVASEVLNMETNAGPRPLVLAGYMSRAEEPLKAFRCLETGRCPGGVAGRCETGRDNTSIACGLCRVDMYDSGIQCHSCSAWSTPSIILAVVIGLFALMVVAWISSSDMHKRSRISSFAVIAIGVVLTAIQTIGVFHDLSVEWVEPLNTLFDLAATVTVDLKVVRTQCWFGRGPVVGFGIRQFSPFLCAPIVTAALLCRSFRNAKLNIRVESWNAFGTVLNAFYIGLLKSCLSPFMCYDHPDDHGVSIIEYPSVLCWSNDGTFYTLAGLSITGFLCLPLPFTAAAVYAAVKHKALLADQTPANFRTLQTFRFMWFRFSHERYYYGLLQLLRNFLVSIVPIFAAYDPVVQVGCMVLLMLFFGVLQSYLQPWRTLEANIFDTATTNVIVGALLCAAMASNLEAYQDSLTIVAIIVIIFFSTLLVGAVLVVLMNVLYARNFMYDYFLCHHKLHAGAQARLMKMLLQNKAKTVFIDSDDLRDLDSLFDTVKFHIKSLVVYLTGQTLTRPWCAGEIFSAHRCSVAMVAIRTQTFRQPTSEALNQVGALLDESTCSLSDYQISYDDISEAYKKLLSPLVQNHEIDSSTVGSRRVRRLINELVRESPYHSTDSGAQDPSALRHQDGLLVICCDPEDDEALAAAEILSMLLTQQAHESERQICRLFDYYPADPDVQRDVVTQAWGVVVIFSRNTFRCRTQVKVLVDAAQLKSTGGGEVVPVTIPGFEFPTGELIRDDLLPVETVEDERDAIRQFFKLVAVLFPTHGSEYVLKVQSKEVWQRLFPVVNVRSFLTTVKSKAQMSNEPSVKSTPSSPTLPSPSHSSPRLDAVPPRSGGSREVKDKGHEAEDPTVYDI